MRKKNAAFVLTTRRDARIGTGVAALRRVRRIIVPLPQRITADDSLYGVRVRGDLRADGSWEPCIEFESRRGIHLETCPALTLTSPAELKNWAEHLDEKFLLDALSRASKGPIRRVRKPRTAK